jgi:hypothetical protein
MDKQEPRRPEVFSYSTGMSLRPPGPAPRSWIVWVQLTAIVLISAALLFGLFYLLLTLDPAALLDSVRGAIHGGPSIAS